MSRQVFISGAKWEETVGYSRAVRVGNVIEVSGTVANDNGKIVGKGNPYKQAQFILSKIKGIIEEAGGSINDVVRTRIYVVDISKWEEIGRAHAEFFREIKPATSMVEVSNLIDSDYLVEIEASVIID